MADEKPKDDVTKAVDSKAPAKVSRYFTVVLDDGKRLQSTSEDAEAKLQGNARSIGKDGYDFEENGVWTHYPARRVTKITVQVVE